MPIQLNLFIQAQRGAEVKEGHSSYNTAKEELNAGAKITHWIWYVFPQFTHKSSSLTSQKYGIETLYDAIDYLNNPELREHYCEVVGIVHQKICKDQIPVLILMNGKLDVLKLQSSLTLFGFAAKQLENASIDPIKQLILNCEQVLDKITPCKQTHARCSQAILAPCLANPMPAESQPDPHQSKPTWINMQLLGGLIGVLGIAAVAIAFTVLQAATLGIPGLILASVGMVGILAGIGLFKKGCDQYHPLRSEKVKGSVNKEGRGQIC